MQRADLGLREEKIGIPCGRVTYAGEVRDTLFCGVIEIGVELGLARSLNASRRQAGTKEECVELGTTVRVRCVVVARGRTLT